MSDEPAAVCPESSCTSGVRRSTLRPHVVLQELYWLQVQHRVDFKMVTLIYLSLSGMVPSYLASETKVVVSCVLPHQGRTDRPTAIMQTGVLQLKVQISGTPFQLICDKLTLAFNDLNGY